MHRPFLVTTLLALLLGVPSLAAADVLLIERVQASHERPLPRRGSSMAQVEAQFGVPQRKHPPVGGDRPQHPPITRWDYPEFTVYFEHDHVVDAVLNKALPNEMGPRPAHSNP